jgi:hypothetical protein
VQLLEGPLNYERFSFYASQFLAPTLRRGDVLVLNNLVAHKLGRLREWPAQRGGEVLFLLSFISSTFRPLSRPDASSKWLYARPAPVVGRRSKRLFRRLSIG